MIRGWLQTLRGRLLLVPGLGLAVLLGALASNVVQLRAVGQSLDVVNQVYLPIATWSARASGQVERRPGGAELVDRAMHEIQAALEEVPPVGDAEETAALGATRSRVAALVLAWNAWQRADRTGVEAAAALRDELLQLNALADGRIRTVSVKAGRAQGVAIRRSVGLVLAALLTGGAILYLTFRALAPVSRLTAQARGMAQGDAVEPVLLGGSDEIATLANTFARMARAVADRDQHLQALTLYLRRVLDSIGAGVLVVEVGRVRMANPPAERLWGVREGEPLPEGLAALSEGRHEGLVAGDRLQDVVVRPFDQAGRIYIGEDSTERERDRQRLARSERLALVGQMLAQVTHEVRNPLNALSLHTELLGDEVSTDEGRALLAVIAQEIRRLEEVTERYLDLARRRAPERAPEDPVSLARAVAGLEDEGLRRQGIAISVLGREGDLCEVDGSLLRRALLNLVRNAAEGGARNIVVEVRREPGMLEISVEDDGPGMPEDVAARVFEPFYSTRSKGTGLGLTITRQSIEDLDGQLTCRTAVGAGSRFTMRLPVTGS